MLALLLCIGAAAAASPSWPDLGVPPATTGGGERDVALVVAIEDYVFATDLPGAVDNAQAWTRWLRETRGVGTVKVLTDTQATREEILAAAKGVGARGQPGGRTWVVFIGHGAPKRDGTDGLLVGVDAQQSELSVEARSVARVAGFDRLSL